MLCSKHKNYKGLRKPKRNCPGCLSVYEEKQSLQKDRLSFYSLTTPDFKCGPIHVFTELICLMLYGPLPPFFWRKNCSSPIIKSVEIRKEYQSLYKEIKYWNNRNKAFFDKLYRFIYSIYAKRCIKIRCEPVNIKVETIEKQGESKKADLSSLSDIDKKINKWKIIKLLGEANGQEKKQS